MRLHTAGWMIWSSHAAIPSGRGPPSAWGRYTRRLGSARYAPEGTRLGRSVSRSHRPSAYGSPVTPSTPGAAFRFHPKYAPGRAFTGMGGHRPPPTLRFRLPLRGRPYSLNRWDPLPRSGGRPGLGSREFPWAPALRSLDSAGPGGPWFADFLATRAGSDGSKPGLIGYGNPFPTRPRATAGQLGDHPGPHAGRINRLRFSDPVESSVASP